MPDTYLVGYGHGSASEAAVRFALRLAAPVHAEVIAAHVLAEQLGPGHWADARARAETLLHGLDGLVGDRRVVEGPTAHGLHDLAIDVGASLLLVGATHRGAFGRMVPGSVGERLIHASPCPLAIVPEQDDHPLTHVAVAVDDREPSRTALRLACAIAQQHQAELVLLSVEEPVLTLGDRLLRAGEHAPGRAAGPAAVDDVLASARALIPAGLVVTVRPLSGPAGPALVNACAEDVDLLVAGSRGYGPVHSVLVGGVARHLTDHAPCPVIVVPRIHEPGRRHWSDADSAAAAT